MVMSDTDTSEVASFDFFNRMSICGSCEHMRKTITISKCDLCGCLLALKARQKGASCPIGKW
jgi:hypothetical protein